MVWTLEAGKKILCAYKAARLAHLVEHQTCKPESGSCQFVNAIDTALSSTFDSTSLAVVPSTNLYAWFFACQCLIGQKIKNFSGCIKFLFNV